MSRTGVRLSELRSESSATIVDRIRAAQANGVPWLDVLNRGRPVCHLGLEADMPSEWQLAEPLSASLSDLQRGQISITALRKQGRALYITQRSGPTLALWPVEADYERPQDMSMPEQLAYLQQEVRSLRRRVLQLERHNDALSEGVALLARLLPPRKRRPIAENEGEDEATTEGDEPPPRDA